MSVRAGDGGRLYGSITPAEIVDAVRQRRRPRPRQAAGVELPGHVKSVGDYKVRVKLHPEVAANFTLTVTAAK